ncbi:GEM-like protein 2 isoform X1 [Quercus lobata]|uniref:GEM-like protein 2 isoform X1 n=1 Tax=Quercus lobata TaxID=97700 RepID=UPI0012447CBD|nr:GEM-like protein 2 isoform X1 [Quercus lobata]
MYNHSQSQVPPLTNNNHNQHTNNPYIIISPDPTSSYSSCKRPIDRMFDTLSRCGKRFEYATRKAEATAGDVWHHLRVSPSLTDAAMARLVQGTKVLAEGGLDHAFQQAFNILPGEELLNSYACYLSTTSGPVIGTLYLSTKRVAFCSDYSFCCYSSTGQPEWMYYKMVVQLDQLRAVNPSANRLNPSEKYIHIVTRDGYEFWFMGFISYDKALKKLSEALQRACNSSGVVSRV